MPGSVSQAAGFHIHEPTTDGKLGGAGAGPTYDHVPQIATRPTTGDARRGRGCYLPQIRTFINLLCADTPSTDRNPSLLPPQAAAPQAPEEAAPEDECAITFDDRHGRASHDETIIYSYPAKAPTPSKPLPLSVAGLVSSARSTAGFGRGCRARPSAAFFKHRYI